jgi:hypothetical protein
VSTAATRDAVRIPLRFGALKPLFVVLGMSPRSSGIAIDPELVTVRAGLWFRATFPRRSLVAVETAPARPWAIGVHTWRNGTWIVNGASSPIARLVLDVPAEGRTLGIRVHPRRIEVSVDDPAALAAALGHELTPPARRSEA